MSTSHPTRRLAATAISVALCSIAWLDPHATVREANRLYDQGKYEEAATSYNQALVDEPGSALLHFNLGAAAYKQGKYTDAANDFEKAAPAADDATRTARVAYNLGNTKYRLAEAAETADPKAALGLYAEALVAYRRAMGAAPADEDAKFNHELAEKRLHDLEKKLEEQRQQQEQQQQPQGQQEQKEQQQQDQQQQPQEDQAQQDRQQEQQEQQQGKEQEDKKEQQPAGEQEAERPKEAEQQAQPQAEKPQAAQQPQPESDQQAASEQAGAAEAKGEDLGRQEAAALLDAQRDQEVRPEEIIRQLQGVVAEPTQDW